MIVLAPRNRTLRSAVIWLLYAVSFVPAAWYFYQAATGALGADPIKTYEHLLGIWALRFLIATLLVTPLIDLADLNLMHYRRAFGLMAFWYVVMHFLVYVILDKNLNLGVVLQDITRRWFIIIGMSAFVMLIPLALTSNQFSIRRLGSKWATLHKLVYVIAAAGVLHFAMSRKSITLEPATYIAIIALLLAYRLVGPRIRTWKNERRKAARLADRERQKAHELSARSGSMEHARGGI
ncbi:protein-methionine-sulfoxide reductase heme-binding subunit MsrQ [Rhizobium sp. NRK18]|uniref:protein-methionine-sulfoxide reductase heme-binding subunit MsrQ n=1 Tax=Rhizobium sp. NRK18 TaxID=2964667 RepID=UPI0021C332A0|nr:protein-methionine-sulfoxide reductase heme-binding subunit MsrQ [Rhizobium sp. NRK18]MCQ2004430.1 protein-methionine-sulfoxide reductase heme-binding subunit MsrQ [Rhizobium sp. NRK18]